MPLNPSNWILILIKDGKPCQFWTLSNAVCILGRAPESEIHLPDASVSRRHAEFASEAHRLSVRDLRSRNGIFVNGVPRQKADLQEGDGVKIGVFQLLVSHTPPAQAPRALPQAATTDVTVYPTAEQSLLLPTGQRERDLATLYYVCFWISDGLGEKEFIPKCLGLLLDALRAQEVHLYSPSGRLEQSVTRGGGKPTLRLAAYLARRFQEMNEATNVNGASVAQHQRDIGQYNYLIGPLRGDNAAQATAPAPFLVILRPSDWVEFEVADRVLLQAVCQQWVRGRAKMAEMENLRQENTRLKARLKEPVLLGNSPAIAKLREQAQRIAATNVTVLLGGETGSGKEVVAQFIHRHSPRNNAPFIKLNCAAIPDGLIESELFGHVQGAFTDARHDRLGKFTLADQGSLLLDEIGEMPLSVQVKVLRAIESGEVEPLGAEAAARVDVRIIAATHRDLAEMAREHRFRHDLFYRLNVVTLRVPPLREHLEDIEILATDFLDRFIAENGLVEMAFAEDAIAELKSYSWPGNVRELRSVVQRCAVSTQTTHITRAEVDAQIRSGRL